MRPRLIVGVDEVGRGPWAGPVVAAAVALPTDNQIRGVKDSKLLSRQRRLELASVIKQRAAGIGIGWASHEEIDRHGLSRAVQLSMQRAIDQLSVDCGQLIIDGKINYLANEYPEAQVIVKADQTHSCVSAASIVAKVARDSYMFKMAKIYPGYGFKKHVGYGTKLHIRRLHKYGPSDLHRVSFRPIWKARIQQLSLV
ncbi:ribonuclease HII [Candidatus Microgenomates bacterium]|nr:ribonuclease HII [Candidatus Microgenomates bacterium]